MVLAAPVVATRALGRKLSRAGLGRVAGMLVVSMLVFVQQFGVGAVALPVGARRVEQQQVDFEVEQVRDGENTSCCKTPAARRRRSP